MTTFPTSTIQDYTDALIANLRLRPALEKTLISDGPPPANLAQVVEWIMFGDVTGSQKFAAISRTRMPKDETYTIDVVISVIAGTTAGDTEVQPALNRRCMEVYAELEDELKTNPTQNVGPATGINPAGYVIVSEILTPVRLQKRGNDTVREAAMEIGIQVKARL